MKDKNEVTLIGNCTHDAEIKITPNGTPISRMRLAISDKQGTEFQPLVMFSGVAEAAGDLLREGDLIYVEGRLQTRNFKKGSESRPTTEIVVKELNILKTPGD